MYISGVLRTILPAVETQRYVVLPIYQGDESCMSKEKSLLTHIDPDIAQ